MNRDRRHSVRIQLSVDCEVQLLMPDETFQPVRCKGVVLNLSLQGAKVRIAGLQPEVFKKLTRPNRYVKLIFSQVEQAKGAQMIGKILWMDYRSKQQLLDLGTAFEQVGPRSQAVLEQLLGKG